MLCSKTAQRSEEMLGRPYQIVARRERRGEHDMRELFMPEDDLLVPLMANTTYLSEMTRLFEQTKVNVFHRPICTWITYALGKNPN